MAHFRKRQRRNNSPKTHGRKCFLARGIQKRDWWDNQPATNTRQRLKAELRRDLDE